jgi:hypothetical protein
MLLLSNKEYLKKWENKNRYLLAADRPDVTQKVGACVFRAAEAYLNRKQGPTLKSYTKLQGMVFQMVQEL